MVASGWTVIQLTEIDACRLLRTGTRLYRMGSDPVMDGVVMDAYRRTALWDGVQDTLPPDVCVCPVTADVVARIGIRMFTDLALVFVRVDGDELDPETAALVIDGPVAVEPPRRRLRGW